MISTDDIEKNVVDYVPDELVGADSAVDGDDDGGELYEHFRFVADKGQELLRVDKFLVARLQKSSRNRVQQAAEAGCILVNGKAVKSNYRVKPLDVVQVVMDRPRYEFEIIAEDIPLDIVYEDDDLLVVNKPAGLVVHPGMGITTALLSMRWHGISVIFRIMMSTILVWGLCTVSTRTHPACLSWPRLPMQRQRSDASFSRKLPNASTWQWYGALPIRPTDVSKEI